MLSTISLITLLLSQACSVAPPLTLDTPIPPAITPTLISPAAEPPAPRGYQTSPQELALIRDLAARGREPLATAVSEVIALANQPWDYALAAMPTCPDADQPAWIDNEGGTPRLYARALAFHLTGEQRYAEETAAILTRIMQEVVQLSDSREERFEQCQLNFAWGIPELVAAADLIETYWAGRTCRGPATTIYGDPTQANGRCKNRLQNWLVKNPYYVISWTASRRTNNWGAAATTATAYIADYLWDRPDLRLLHRHPVQLFNGENRSLSPAQAYQYANQLMLDRINGYRVDYTGESCDYLTINQNSDLPPVKSQISERGIIPDEARRTSYCNTLRYGEEYENYPQLHLSNLIQQCELMLRRGSHTCYDNVDLRDLPRFTYLDPEGIERRVALKPGRGSVERAINAIIVDADMEWRNASSLWVAYRYYARHGRLGQVQHWTQYLDARLECAQDLCFGLLSHSAPIPQTLLPLIRS